MEKIAIIFGGMSTENEVSVKSAKSILNNLDKSKYEIFPIYIDTVGTWLNYNSNQEISNIVTELKNVDVAFPALHGLYGEDGTIQGMLEMLKIPYVGCGILASAVGMDKVYSKIIFEKAGIRQTKHLYVKVLNEEEFVFISSNFEEQIMSIEQLTEICKKELKFPVFVKPSNSGSSIGVSRVSNPHDLKSSIIDAAKFDKKILIEQGISGKEVECAVLGNSNIGIDVSRVGEIVSAENFYSYNAKYSNLDSITYIPAKITPSQIIEIQKLAVKAFKAIEGNGLSRVDFFVEDDSGKIYLNEINTMPGFTNISMYPKLMGDFGYPYSELLDKLIEFAKLSRTPTKSI